MTDSSRVYTKGEIEEIISETSIKMGMDPEHMKAMAWQESGFNVGAVSSAGAAGLFQFIPSTAKQYGLLDRSDPQASAIAACKYMKKLYKDYGDLDIATAAYNCGEGRMNFFRAETVKRGADPNNWEDVRQTILTTPVISKNGPKILEETANYVPAINKHKDRGAWTPARGAKTSAGEVLTKSEPETKWNYITEGAAVEYQDIFQTSIPLSDEARNRLNQPLMVPDGLNVQPWWSEASSYHGPQHSTTVVANPSLLKNSPVYFRLLPLSDTYLTDQDGVPIDLKLYCSLQTKDISLRHKINRNPTRTGIHVTFWGMEADVITASGTTGAWMNQWGLAAGMSILAEKAPPDLREWVRSQGRRMNELDVPSSYETLLANGEPFKITAQDAFVEFLSLFKNNGIIRFKTDNYEEFGRREQLDTALWSTKYGANTYMAGARNNDVMKRGNVMMVSKGDTYLGYFRSLTFSEDANHPFVWNFDFTFQVQHRYQLRVLPFV